jgi:hypothetical protein
VHLQKENSRLKGRIHHLTAVEREKLSLKTMLLNMSVRKVACIVLNFRTRCTQIHCASQFVHRWKFKTTLRKLVKKWIDIVIVVSKDKVCFQNDLFAHLCTENHICTLPLSLTLFHLLFHSLLLSLACSYTHTLTFTLACSLSNALELLQIIQRGDAFSDADIIQWHRKSLEFFPESDKGKYVLYLHMLLSHSLLLSVRHTLKHKHTHYTDIHAHNYIRIRSHTQ